MRSGLDISFTHPSTSPTLDNKQLDPFIIFRTHKYWFPRETGIDLANLEDVDNLLYLL